MGNLRYAFRRADAAKEGGDFYRPSVFSGIEEYVYDITGDYVDETYGKEEDVWREAMNETFSHSCVVDMERVTGITCEPDAIPMVIVSVSTDVNGASAIMNPLIRSFLKVKLNAEKVFVFPSSVHEVIVMPYDEEIPLYECTEMVSSINSEHVDVEEQLSDIAYILDLVTGEVRT